MRMSVDRIGNNEWYVKVHYSKKNLELFKNTAIFNFLRWDGNSNTWYLIQAKDIHRYESYDHELPIDIRDNGIETLGDGVIPFSVIPPEIEEAIKIMKNTGIYKVFEKDRNKKLDN